MTDIGKVRRRIGASLIAIVILGLIVIGALYLLQEGRRAIDGSSSYCSPCHEEDSRPDHLGAHADIACQACHEIPQGSTVKLWAAHLYESIELGEHGELLTKSCAHCHERDDTAWASLISSAGHAEHAVDPGPEGCHQCHSKALHGHQSDENECLVCHEDVPLEDESMVEQACISCHAFARDDHDVPPRPNPNQNGGVQITIEDVHGAADCRFCHSPHADPVDALGDCRRCHRGAIAASVQRLPQQHRACQSCHDVHAPRSERAIPCIQCHDRPEIERRSPSGRLLVDRANESRRRGRSSPKTRPRVRTGEELSRALAEVAEMPHEGRCATCHTPHSGGPWGARCNECHEDQATSLARLPAKSHEGCIHCHEPHSPPPSRDICAGCHDPMRRAARRARKSAHRDCLSCHQAHSGRPDDSTCSTCHHDPPRQLAAGPVRHRECSTCHEPHGDPTAKTLGACRTCHRDQAAGVATAKAAEHHRCAECHQPHRITKAAALSQCGRCHEEPAAATASHQDRCIKCHQPHGRTPESTHDCAQCHRDVQRPTPRQHQRCQDCHRPHQKARQAACERCHEDRVRFASAWPSDNPHGQGCRTCHQPHNEAAQPTCASCHAKQATVAHRGDHNLCSSCHPSHRPRPAGADGWWTGCRSCHDEQAQLSARSSDTHRRCAECHNNPRREPTPCIRCHEDRRMLHSHREHQDCRTCHPSHSNGPVERRACLACHETKTTHYPDAPRCQACHSFAVHQ